MSRLALAPAALGLAGYAGLTAYGVTKLPHTGAWTLLLPLTILVAASVGLMARQLAAFVVARPPNVGGSRGVEGLRYGGALGPADWRT